MTTNNKISNVIESQVPFFVRNDHPNFISFLEAYYEFLEQTGNVVSVSRQTLSYQDIDRTTDEFSTKIYNIFAKLLPENVLVDKAMLIKNIKDFYRAKGTEKAVRFLLRILFDKEADFYYPKTDILKASDGKWFIEKSIKITDVQVNGASNTDINALENFKNKRVTGNTSNASAIIENYDVYYEGTTLIKELKISGTVGDFEDSETIFTLFEENGTTKSITGNVFGSSISSVTINDGGSGYSAGTYIPVESITGTGASLLISGVSTGNLSSIGVVNGGAGFRLNNYVLVSSDTGSGANAIVSSVNTDETYHPNTYNITISLISYEANTPIGNNIFSNLNNTVIDPANNWITNSLISFVFANCGPVEALTITTGGSGYAAAPTMSIVANTRVRELGILGRMEIINGGTGYNVGDKIEFINVPGGYGTGAKGNVISVNTSNSNEITGIRFEQVPGHIVGGSGYRQSFLPRANVISGTGSNANVIVTAVLGDGESLSGATGAIGIIEEVTIVSGGSGYETVPTLNLTSMGDGTANIVATVVSGIYTYPGRYLNDDGHLSSYNFLQNRHYYQNFSYVVRVSESLNKYKDILLKLAHPAGTKLFGEYTYHNDNSQNVTTFEATTTKVIQFKLGKWQANLGNIMVNLTSHGVEQNNTVYLEFVTGDTINISNGIFIVTTANANYFTANATNTTNSSGNVYVGVIT